MSTLLSLVSLWVTRRGSFPALCASSATEQSADRRVNSTSSLTPGRPAQLVRLSAFRKFRSRFSVS